MEKLHNHFLVLSRICMFCSSRSSHKLSKLLVTYNLFFTLLYSSALYTHITVIINSIKNIGSINQVILYFQILTSIIAFFTYLVSNWLNSKNLHHCLSKLLVLDKNIAYFNFQINIKQTCKYYKRLLFFSFLFLFVSTIYDYSIYVLVEKHVGFMYWLSTVLPTIFNYISTSFIGIIIFFLYVRYSQILKFFKKITSRKGSLIYTNVDNMTVVKAFTEMFVQLNKTASVILSLFSLRICGIFVLAITAIISSLNLLLKGRFTLQQYFFISNQLTINFIQLLSIIVLFYQIQLKIEEIVTRATNLVNIQLSKRSHYQVGEKYLKIYDFFANAF